MSQLPPETVFQAVLPIPCRAFAGPADPRGSHCTRTHRTDGRFGGPGAKRARSRAEDTAA